MDQSVPNSQQGKAPQQAFQPATAPSKEKGIVGAPKGKFGRQKRESRLSQSEGQSSGAEDERFGTSLEGKSPYGQSPVLQGMHAKNSYHRNGNLSSSPRSPNTRGHFQARRTRGQQQDEGHSVPTVKASGIPHRQSSRGRNRTSSETEQSSRGPYRRRRGFSEAENGSVWESRVSCAAFFILFFFAPAYIPLKSLSALCLFVLIDCITLDHEWSQSNTAFASLSRTLDYFIEFKFQEAERSSIQSFAPVHHHKVPSVSGLSPRLGRLLRQDVISCLDCAKTCWNESLRCSSLGCGLSV